MVETDRLSDEELRELIRHYEVLMGDSFEIVRYAAARGLPLTAIYLECRKNVAQLRQVLEKK